MKRRGILTFPLRTRGWIAFGLFSLLLLSPLETDARFINLGGSLDFSYMDTKIASEVSGTDKTTLFSQRYNLHNYGELFSPRIGNLMLTGTFQTQETKTSRRGDQNFQFMDYSAMTNLFPYSSPLNLYYQKMNRVNEISASELQKGYDVEDRQTTLGGQWMLLSQRLPRIRVSYNQTELESKDDANRLPNSINRFFNLESSGRFRETSLTARFQSNEAEVARRATALTPNGRVETIKGNSLNLSSESRLAPALIATTYLRLANRSGGSSPGVTFNQERGLGGSISYTPSVKWGTHARVNLTETPGGGPGGDFKQQNAFWSGTYRPTEEMDMVVSGRYSRFDINDVETTSPYGDVGVNYRPFFGLSTGVGASYGQTKTKGDICTKLPAPVSCQSMDVTNDYQRYRGNVDYTRALELVRYSTGYAISHGTSDTKGQGNSERSKNIMNTVSFTLENTQVRYVRVSMGYTFNDLVSNGSDKDVQDTGDQRSHLVQLNADSSYFRGLLRADDSVLLQSTASWTKIDGFGAVGESILADARGNYYFFPGAMLAAGMTHQNYPSGYSSDSNTYYQDLSWNFVIGATSFTFATGARQLRSSGDTTLDRDTLQASGGASYRIGKFALTADARWSDDQSEAQGVDTETRTVLVRASRSF